MLEEISLEGNDLADLQAAKSLSLAMKNRPTLQKVNAIICMDIGGMHNAEISTPDIAKELIYGCENMVEAHLATE